MSRPSVGIREQWVNEVERRHSAGPFCRKSPAAERRKSPAATPRAFALVLMTALLIGGFIGCSGSGGPFAGVGRPALRIGVSPNYPPMAFERDGEIVGVEADLARIVGDALGRRVVFERHPFTDLLDVLVRGDVDVVMSGMSVTPERSARVRFTQSYMQVGQLALIRTSDIARFGRTQLIRRPGVRIGYQRGTTGERFVATELSLARSFAFEDIDSGVRSLRAGRIDYFVHDAPTIWRLAGDPRSRDLQGLYHPLTEEHLAWAVRQGDTKLHALLDATLEHLKREGRIEPIVDRWIPVRVTIR
jgi:ABC-type amino acid transport substrate-binding protein